MTFSPCARAVVTTLLWYRLGENDPGAAPGVTVTNTIDNSGSHPLPVFSQATYSSDVAYSASSHLASSLSMQFTNSAYALSGNPASSLADNFGIECWVKPVSSSGTQVIAYNGNTALSGWGLLIDASGYMALLGGRDEFGSGVVVPNLWTHLAVVCTNGTSVLYVNGIPSGSSTTAPNTPAGAFGLAAPPQAPSSQFFTGGVDEVRIFTFAPGQFSQSDLLVNHNDTVFTLADDGSAASLRSVIGDALNGDKITFLVNGTITLTNGEIPVSANVNISGPGATNLAISGNGASRAFNVISNQVQMSGLTIRNCVATSTFSGAGGAIANAGSLTLSNCVISGCAAMTGVSQIGSGAAGGPGGNGGGIYNTGTLSLVACTLANNEGGTGGRGGPGSSLLLGGQGGSGGNGGALFSTGTLVLSGCTLTGNSAGAGGPGGAAGSLGIPGPVGIAGAGGAIDSSGSGTATLTSCTIDNNSAAAGGVAGGIRNDGVMTLIASTVTRNNGQNTGGGVYSTNEFTARNCIFAENTAASSPDYYGPFFSQGHNLIGNNSGSFGFFPPDNDIVGTSSAPINPIIGPLANNGGPTFTVALRAGSPAIDAGDDTLLSAGVTTDQRGLPRKSGAHVDIGAYETIIGTAPRLTSLGISNQMFGLAFTNTPYAAFTVLSSTNVALQLSNWTVAGLPTQPSPGQFQFFDPSITNTPQQFYTVRSP